MKKRISAVCAVIASAALFSCAATGGGKGAGLLSLDEALAQSPAEAGGNRWL
ncbi:MAG: hypothetical protein LBP88_09185 [Treponema sp.]|nr:hypothetical protein [Treponema sp.]